MAEQAIGVGLSAVPVVTQHYHKVWEPAKQQYKKMKGEVVGPDPDVRDHRTHEERGYMLKKRSELQSDEEVIETVRHRGEVRPRRPNYNKRASSADGAGWKYAGAGAAGGAAAGYDSEGSVPPRSRVRAKSQSGRSQRRGSSSSSTSTSDLGSSTDEEKECKKMQRKKWITAALASVATIHAASKVYSSIEAHDKRIEEVKQGKMSPTEADKKQRSARWQDAAAIGIAALGIKGAISEWNEVQEEHEHHKEMMRKNEEHHKKRLEKQRREKARGSTGYYKGRDGYWYYDGEQPQHSERRQSQLDGPRNGERKMIEGSSRPRGKSYDDYRSRNRSQYGGEDDDYYSRARRGSRRDDNY